MEEQSKIRILLVEDDPDWRRGLSGYLAAEPDLIVTAQADTAEAALDALTAADFDVVLMDIMLASKAEGIWLTERVLAETQARVLMLTSMQDKELILDAFRAGAVDYLVKSDFAAIPAAIRDAYRNRSPISALAAADMREEFRRLKRLEHEVKVKEVRDRITPMELEILREIDKGRSQSEIAERFFISLRTVKIHVGNVLRKFGGTSSRETARKLRELGVLEEGAKDDGES